MSWHLKNSRQREENQDIFSTDKYTYKPSKKENRPYELRKSLANLVQKPLMQILGLTRGFTEYDLNGCLTDALAFKANSPARAWQIIAELREKKKNEKNNKTRRSTTS